MILGVGIPFLLKKPLRRLFKKAYPFLKCAVCLLLFFFTVSFSILTGILFAERGTGKNDVYTSDTVFIVFGAKVEGNGSPSPTLADRLDLAAEAMKSTPGSVAIVTGSRGVNEPRAEAEAMREYLIAAGIEESRIITEDHAINTIENVKYSLPLVGESKKDSIVCVSTYTHTPRIRLLMTREGVKCRYLASDYSRKEFVFPALVREYLSYVKLFAGA